MSHTPIFYQHKGLWERRGALPEWIEIACGNHPKFSGSAQKYDNEGYNIWHYWANANAPEDLWKDVRNSVGNQHDLDCSNNGEHPLHRILLTSKKNAAHLWLTNAATPFFSTMFLDTFWHSIAWSGDANLLKEIAPYLPLENINAQDEIGVTPVIVACHRGSIDFVKEFLFLGSDPNVCDEQKRSLLHHIALYGDISNYTEIQDFGALDDLRNERGQTAQTVLKDRMKHGTASDFESTRMYWEKKWAAKLMF